ncbi:MAG: M16 family metallopeptidase, partial [Thermaurantiacus sp.]
MTIARIGRWTGRLAGLCALALVSGAAAASELPPPAPLTELVERVDIPFERFTLNNGLRVVVHTDRKAPLVHVGVWYHVGSKDEPKGMSGFAHLFEHIMFRGSEHSRQDHFRPLEDVGATDFNGTTSFERTNYFQTVPTPALELALFLESDRMGWLLPALTQEILDQERGIVLNEKRQAENAPGGLVNTALLRALFPPDHPYSVSAIGLVPDLEAATLEDAKGWFRSHYGPNNAVLVLAGDIDMASARPLVERYFGQIPPGPQPARLAAPVPERPETTREMLSDKVAQPVLFRAWALPGRGTPGIADLSVGMAALANGPTSFLFERLVRQERLAVGVSGGISAFEGVGMARLSVEVRPGADPAAVEQRIDALLAEFLASGPDADEVERVKMRTVAATIRGLEKVGGFGGKGVALAEGLLYADDPGLYRRELMEVAAATPESATAAMRRWLVA